MISFTRVKSWSCDSSNDVNKLDLLFFSNMPNDQKDPLYGSILAKFITLITITIVQKADVEQIYQPFISSPSRCKL